MFAGPHAVPPHAVPPHAAVSDVRRRSAARHDNVRHRDAVSTPPADRGNGVGPAASLRRAATLSGTSELRRQRRRLRRRATANNHDGSPTTISNDDDSHDDIPTTTTTKIFHRLASLSPRTRGSPVLQHSPLPTSASSFPTWSPTTTIPPHPPRTPSLLGSASPNLQKATVISTTIASPSSPGSPSSMQSQSQQSQQQQVPIQQQQQQQQQGVRSQRRRKPSGDIPVSQRYQQRTGIDTVFSAQRRPLSISTDLDWARNSGSISPHRLDPHPPHGIQFVRLASERPRHSRTLSDTVITYPYPASPTPPPQHFGLRIRGSTSVSTPLTSSQLRSEAQLLTASPTTLNPPTSATSNASATPTSAQFSPDTDDQGHDADIDLNSPIVDDGNNRGDLTPMMSSGNSMNQPIPTITIGGSTPTRAKDNGEQSLPLSKDSLTAGFMPQRSIIPRQMSTSSISSLGSIGEENDDTDGIPFDSELMQSPSFTDDNLVKEDNGIRSDSDGSLMSPVMSGNGSARIPLELGSPVTTFEPNVSLIEESTGVASEPLPVKKPPLSTPPSSVAVSQSSMSELSNQLTTDTYGCSPPAPRSSKSKLVKGGYLRLFRRSSSGKNSRSSRDEASNQSTSNNSSSNSLALAPSALAGCTPPMSSPLLHAAQIDSASYISPSPTDTHSLTLNFDPPDASTPLNGSSPNAPQTPSIDSHSQSLISSSIFGHGHKSPSNAFSSLFSRKHSRTPSSSSQPNAGGGGESPATSPPVPARWNTVGVERPDSSESNKKKSAGHRRSFSSSHKTKSTNNNSALVTRRRGASFSTEFITYTPIEQQQQQQHQHHQHGKTRIHLHGSPDIVNENFGPHGLSSTSRESMDMSRNKTWASKFGVNRRTEICDECYVCAGDHILSSSLPESTLFKDSEYAKDAQSPRPSADLAPLSSSFTSVRAIHPSITDRSNATTEYNVVSSNIRTHLDSPPLVSLQGCLLHPGSRLTQNSMNVGNKNRHLLFTHSTVFKYDDDSPPEKIHKSRIQTTKFHLHPSKITADELATKSDGNPVGGTYSTLPPHYFRNIRERQLDALGYEPTEIVDAITMNSTSHTSEYFNVELTTIGRFPDRDLGLRESETDQYIDESAIQQRTEVNQDTVQRPVTTPVSNSISSLPTTTKLSPIMSGDSLSELINGRPTESNSSVRIGIPTGNHEGMSPTGETQIIPLSKIPISMDSDTDVVDTPDSENAELNVDGTLPGGLVGMTNVTNDDGDHTSTPNFLPTNDTMIECNQVPTPSFENISIATGSSTPLQSTLPQLSNAGEASTEMNSGLGTSTVNSPIRCTDGSTPIIADNSKWPDSLLLLSETSSSTLIPPAADIYALESKTGALSLGSSKQKISKKNDLNKATGMVSLPSQDSRYSDGKLESTSGSVGSLGKGNNNNNETKNGSRGGGGDASVSNKSQSYPGRLLGKFLGSSKN